MPFIPFNKPYMTGKELQYIELAYQNLHLSGDGEFTQKCHTWLESHTLCNKALLTHSCTAALEMAALLVDIEQGDEIIMPSYTFVSSANAFVLRGGVPVFVDIRSDTLNIDEKRIEEAITSRTKVIVVVHYAGVSCEMDAITGLAKKYNLVVIEDAAQGVMSTYKGRALGSIGDLGCYSFHETKNIISGEGGALIINDSDYSERAECIREKGTNRSRFIRGEVDKYTWVDIGSSYLPGEVTAAFLWAQMESSLDITQQRIQTWLIYHELLEPLETGGFLSRPVIPETCEHNAHMYYIVLSDSILRNELIDYLAKNEVNSVFHYIPLHSSPAGMHYGKNPVTLETTNRVAESLVRLPLYVGLGETEVGYICDLVFKFFDAPR